MPRQRHERAIARAHAARRRAGQARERAAKCRERGEEWFAEVEERLLAAEELVIANAEMLIARLSRADLTDGTTTERLEAARAAQRKALEYARIHHERREIGRARRHEDAAAGFGILAEMLEDHLRAEQQHHDPCLNGNVPDDIAGAIDVPVASGPVAA